MPPSLWGQGQTNVIKASLTLQLTSAAELIDSDRLLCIESLKSTHLHGIISFSVQNENFLDKNKKNKNLCL